MEIVLNDVENHVESVSLGLLPTVLKSREVAVPKPLPDPTVAQLRVEVAELSIALESLRRQVKQFDRDLSDAIDGFYRRRQSDKMRDIREEEDAKKPKVRTWKDLLNSPVIRGETEKTGE